MLAQNQGIFYSKGENIFRLAEAVPNKAGNRETFHQTGHPTFITGSVQFGQGLQGRGATEQEEAVVLGGVRHPFNKTSPSL